MRNLRFFLIQIVYIFLGISAGIAVLILHEDAQPGIIIALVSLFFMVSSGDRIRQERRRAGEYARLRDHSVKVEKSIQVLKNSLDKKMNVLILESSSVSSLIQELKDDIRGPDASSIGANGMSTESNLWSLPDTSEEKPRPTSGRIAAQVADDPTRLAKLAEMLRSKSSTIGTIYVVGSSELRDYLASRSYYVVSLLPDTHLETQEIGEHDRLVIEAPGLYSGVWAGVLGGSGGGLIIRLIQIAKSIQSRGGMVYTIDSISTKDIFSEEVIALSDVVINADLYRTTDWISDAPTSFSNLLFSFSCKTDGEIN